MMLISRKYDLVLFGATGDVGRATTKYVAQHAPPNFRWAVAGRSTTKLENLINSIYPKPTCDLLHASCDDANSMTQMAQSTRLVLTAAGPYSALGEPVMLACLSGGTHYVDITGEVDWVTSMRQKYDAQAKAAGLCFCSFCGYDCIPAELAVFNARKKLPPSEPARSAECIFCVGDAGSPRGTMLTALSGSLPRLIKGLFEFVPRAERRFLALSLVFWLLPRWSSRVGAFTLPHIMGWCNTPIVLASDATTRAKGAAGLRYYHDRQVSASAHQWLGIRGLVELLLSYTVALIALPLLSIATSLPPVRTRLVRYLEQSYSYDGTWDSRVTVFARVCGESGTIADGEFSCPGDPGIQCTALLAAQTAMAMLESPRLPAGLITPVVALGDALSERLRKAGVRIL